MSLNYLQAITKSRYTMIYVGDKLVYEHRVVMEQHLGRKLRRGEIIHHINGDPKDNKIKNLQLTTSVGHKKYHPTPHYRKFTNDQVNWVRTLAITTDHTFKRIGIITGVGATTICNIVRERIYEDVPFTPYIPN